MQVLKMTSKAEIIFNNRQIVEKQLNEELLKNQKKFLNKLSEVTPEPIYVFEMYQFEEDVVKTKKDIYNYPIRYINTRLKTNHETCLEIDKLPFEQAKNIIFETSLALMRNNIPFMMFCSENSRSPHLRVYRLHQLEELNPLQRIKGQLEFWKRYVPMGTIPYMDQGVLVDGHPLQLEFSIHWKHLIPFYCIGDYEKKQETYEEMINRVKERAKSHTQINKIENKSRVVPNWEKRDKEEREAHERRIKNVI